MAVSAMDDRGYAIAGGYRLEYRWVGGAQENAGGVEGFQRLPSQISTKRPVLVFMHDEIGCIEGWRQFPDRVASMTGCRAFLYSRSGYGGSDGISPPRSNHYLHDEALIVLPEMLDAAKIDKAILIGLGDGASISLIHTASDVDDRIVGIAALSPFLFMEGRTLDSIQRAVLAYEKDNLRQRLELYHGDNVDGAFYGWTKTWGSSSFARWNIEACLPGINVPVLAVHGDRDEFTSTEQIEALISGLPRQPETVILKGSGHYVHRDSPDMVLATLIRFIQLRIIEMNKP